MLEISGPAINQANLELVTLAQWKAWAGHLESSDDVPLQNILDAVHYDVHRYTGRVLKSTGAAWVYGLRSMSDVLYLPQWPIIAVTSIKTGYVADKDYTFTEWSTLQDNEWYADKNKGTLHAVQGYWPRTFASVRVEWTAGYVSGAYPEDLRNAIMEWVMVKFDRRDRLDQSSDSKEQKSYTYREHEIPLHARHVLERYRRLEMSFYA